MQAYYHVSARHVAMAAGKECWCWKLWKICKSLNMI